MSEANAQPLEGKLASRERQRPEEGNRSNGTRISQMKRIKQNQD